MITYGKRENVEEYFSTTGRASQSFLKSLLRGVENLKSEDKKLYFEEKGHFLIGSGVDTKITMESGEFEKDYHMSEINKPSDTVKSIVTKIFDDYTYGLDDSEEVRPLEELPDLILESCTYHSYQGRWGDETKINKIILEGSEYFQDLINSRGKEILSAVESTIIDNIVMSFKSHRFTEKYFKDGDGIDIYYQVPIYFSVNGVDSKALLDMVIVNRGDRTILPIDLKTMAGLTKYFPSSLKGRRYDFQASFYTTALIELLDGEATSPVEMNVDNSYKVEEFKFIVESTDTYTNKMTGEVSYGQGTPLVFTLSGEVLTDAFKGKPQVMVQAFAEADENMGILPVYPIKYKEQKGVLQALELYTWHEENGYEFDKEVQESQGELRID